VARWRNATENGGMSAEKKGLRSIEKRHPQAFEIERLRQELDGEREARRALEAKVDALLAGMREMERMYQSQVNQLEVQNRDLRAKLEAAEKRIAWFEKEKFGSQDERLPEGAAIELEFNEPGSARSNEPGAKDGNEPGAVEFNEPRSLKHNEPGARGANEPNASALPKGQQAGKPGHGRTDRSKVPVAETHTLRIPGGCACVTCGKQYLELPETDDSRIAECLFWVYMVMYRRVRYAPQCKCKGNKIETAAPPPRLYPRTTIGNSLWVHLVVQKFLHGTPTNRTLKGLSLAGLPLAHGTIVGGFKLISVLIEPLYDAIFEHCQGSDFWNGDETTWRVMDAEKIKWWLWLIASMDSVVYILDPSRSKDVPQDFFGGAAGALMTDRLASYKKLSEAIKKAWCWIHQRRDIFKIFIGVPALKEWAKEWLELIAMLFILEHDRNEVWQQGKTSGSVWDAAQKKLEAHVDTLKARWESELRLPNLHKIQKQALNSFKRHWAGLTIFLSDPRIPLHNNRAERLIRAAVLLRKSSYGSGTQWSGTFTARILTVLQTWLINGLNAEALLLDYFNECSKTPGKAPSDLKEFLPWSMSEERKREFGLPAEYQKPG
jgi:transposase